MLKQLDIEAGRPDRSLEVSRDLREGAPPDLTILGYESGLAARQISGADNERRGDRPRGRQQSPAEAGRGGVAARHQAVQLYRQAFIEAASATHPIQPVGTDTAEVRACYHLRNNACAAETEGEGNLG